MNKNLPPILQNQLFLNDVHNMALQHHIEGLLYKRYLPYSDSKSFKDKWLVQWQYNLSLKDQLQILGKRIQNKLCGDIIVLKGMALTDTLYYDLGSRFMSDIDILIDPRDKELIFSNLENMGYSQNHHRKWKGNHFKSEWIKSFGNYEVNIEIHSSLFYHSKPYGMKLEDFSIHPFKKLSLEDLIVHLCGHLVFQHTFLKLYWSFDLLILIEKHINQINWEEILLKGKKNKVYRSIQMSIWALNKYFGLEVSEKILTLFKINRSHLWMLFLNEKLILGLNNNGLHYFLIKHLSKDNLLEAFSYDILWSSNLLKRKLLKSDK